MPTSGNLKSGDSFFCIPPLNINDQPPLHKHSLIQSLISWGHYNFMKSYMRYRSITISFYDCDGEIIFVSNEIPTKMPQKPNFDSKEIRILGKNGINSKLKHRKAHNSILSRRLVTLTGDCCCFRESWHVW